MEGFWQALDDAHVEVMNATGWGVLLDRLTAQWRNGGSGMVQYFYQQTAAFVAAVNWSEPFFKYLAAFHVIIVVTVALLTRGASAERICVVDMFVLFLAYCSSYLNDFGRLHAAQIFQEKGLNYFDNDGFFICVVYWFPLFLVALWLQARIILQILQLLVRMKRQRILRKMKQSTMSAATAKETTASASFFGTTEVNKKR